MTRTPSATADRENAVASRARALRILSLNCGFQGTGIGDYARTLDGVLEARHGFAIETVGGQCACESRVEGCRYPARDHLQTTFLERQLHRVDRRLHPDNPIGASQMLRGVRYLSRIREGRYDLVHYHLDRSYYGLHPLWTITRQRRTPVIVTVHEVEAWGRLTRAALRGAARLIVHSSELRRRIVSFCGPLEVVEIPHGTWPDPSPFEGPRLGVGLFGHLGPDKGIDVVVEALATLARQGVTTELHLVGNYFPEERARAERLLDRRAILGQARFHGLVDEARLHQAMREQEVVLTPYLRSSGSGVVARAMGHATPVVTSDVGDLAAYVGDGGWVVSPGRADALATALGEALADREATRERGRSAWRRARERYAWDIVAARVAALYREVAG